MKIMKNSYFIGNVARLGLAIALLAGCAGKTKFGERELPDWVVDESLVKSSPDELTAVGMSDGLSGNLRLGIAQAEADARANLATKILANVSRKVDDIINQSVGSPQCQVDKSKKEVCKIEHYSSFKQHSEVAVKEVKVVSSSRRHIATIDNFVYVAIAMPKDAAEKQVSEALSNLSSEDKKNAQLYKELLSKTKAADLSNTVSKPSSL